MHDVLTTLGLAVPVWQAPMAGANDHALAIAVCEAGGLGGLPCAMLDADGMRRALDAMRAGTSRPFNVNFFAHRPPVADESRDAAWRAALRPHHDAHGIDASSIRPGPGRRPFDAAAAEVVEWAKPAVVSFHFGLPEAQLLERVRATGARVVSSATTVDEALWLERHGVDAIVAQGLEAGGHRGHFLADDIGLQMGTFALLPQVVRAVRVPVIAAGGIADAAGVRAALALGAAAVQVGTVFLRCPEATTSAVHRAALAGDGRRHTALTRLFTGRPARGIVNRVMREVPDAAAPAFPLATAAMAPLRAAAEARGSGDYSPLWAGQNTDGCVERPAGEVVRGLAS